MSPRTEKFKMVGVGAPLTMEIRHRNLTQVILRDTEGKRVAVGTAIHNPKDPFSPALGEEIALGRIAKEIEEESGGGYDRRDVLRDLLGELKVYRESTLPSIVEVPSLPPSSLIKPFSDQLVEYEAYLGPQIAGEPPSPKSRPFEIGDRVRVVSYPSHDSHSPLGKTGFVVEPSDYIIGHIRVVLDDDGRGFLFEFNELKLLTPASEAPEASELEKGLNTLPEDWKSC